MTIVGFNSGYIFSTDFFNKPPPNQNPLIGVTGRETIVNCSDVQTLIANLEMTENSLLPEGAGHGLYLTMECVKNALFFDERYRDSPEKFDKLVTTYSAPIFFTHFFNNPQPNQSPLIGSSRGDTTTNCSALLSLIIYLETNEEVFLVDGAGRGIYLMTKCVINALCFEDDYRDFIDAYRRLAQERERLEDRKKNEECSEKKRKFVEKEMLNTADGKPNSSDTEENPTI